MYKDVITSDRLGDERDLTLDGWINQSINQSINCVMFLCVRTKEDSCTGSTFSEQHQEQSTVEVQLDLFEYSVSSSILRLYTAGLYSFRVVSRGAMTASCCWCQHHTLGRSVEGGVRVEF